MTTPKRNTALLKSAEEYPSVPVLAWHDPFSGAWVYGTLIPLDDQWAYECEGDCGSTSSVIIWGEDCIAECSTCVQSTQRPDTEEAILIERSPCGYCTETPVVALVQHGWHPVAVCATHLAIYETSPTQDTDSESHLHTKKVVRL